MERLLPPERAVFVLREAFDLPSGDIAQIVGGPAGTRRQLTVGRRSGWPGDRAKRHGMTRTTRGRAGDQWLRGKTLTWAVCPSCVSLWSQVYSGAASASASAR